MNQVDAVIVRLLDPQSVAKLYPYVAPDGWAYKMCGTQSEDYKYTVTCTRLANHGGPHVAHGIHNRVVWFWPREA